MDKKEYAIKLEKYLVELKETMPVSEQVHAWGFGAIDFAVKIGVISTDEGDRLLREYNTRFGKDHWNEWLNE